MCNGANYYSEKNTCALYGGQITDNTANEPTIGRVGIKIDNSRICDNSYVQKVGDVKSLVCDMPQMTGVSDMHG